MRQRTGTLTITVPLYDDSSHHGISGTLYSVANDVFAGEIDVSSDDEAIIRLGDTVAGKWAVELFNPEATKCR